MPPSEPTNSDARDIATHVQDVVWSLRRFGEKQAGLALIPHSEVEVLRLIVAHPGSTVSDIARTLELQSSNVSTTVRHLVERKLVERTEDPADRRSHRLHVTPLARREGQRIDQAWVDAIGRQLDTMTPEETALLAAAAPLFGRLAAMTGTT
ncbi:MAG: winged helix-turn-helix transcriptional regulator [Rhodococcus sp.]|nr:winged helix-turn-helix transcriptional regulator [Rhodococcus sp. (in: high G+C Gram-positive bacteria)]